MIDITSTWRNYFINPDEGLGTTYERFILHRHFEAIKSHFSISSVIEAPSFGMTGISGINSMWWALQGVPVTVVDDDKERLELTQKVWNDISLRADFIHHSPLEAKLPFGDHSFDMSWNFAALWFVPELDAFMDELARVTRHVIFICVPNRYGLGFMSRRLLAGKSGTGLHMGNIHAGKIKEAMAKKGWLIREEGLLDVPPWPDIAMKKEDLLKKIGLGWIARRLAGRAEGQMCILDFYSGKNKTMEQEIMKYAFLEDAPRIIQRFWAHHEWFIFTPARNEKS
jgi:SAM-dependent methyltransferase